VKPYRSVPENECSLPDLSAITGDVRRGRVHINLIRKRPLNYPEEKLNQKLNLGKDNIKGRIYDSLRVSNDIFSFCNYFRNILEKIKLIQGQFRDFSATVGEIPATS